MQRLPVWALVIYCGGYLWSSFQFCANYSLWRQGLFFLPMSYYTAPLRKHFPVGVLFLFLLFLKNSGKRKFILLPFSSKMTTAGCLPNSFVLSVSGHRVKLEDQKMQFSDRLSEIERYQRSMRIGPMNNNPRPIHQTPLSTTPGEDRWHMQPQATKNSKNHTALCKILLCLGK